MNSSTGNLIYSNNPYKLILSVDNELGNLYRSLIPKSFQVRKPLYNSHISIVRNEDKLALEHWNKYSDLEVSFMYDSFIYNDETYFWLNAVCPFLEDIRLELGLSNISDYTKSPDGNHNFHITIGNLKY